MASSARIDELRKKFDENPRRYFAPLANEYRKAGDLDQAIFICQEYLPQQPGHMSGHIVYGQALYELNRHDEARVVFETANKCEAARSNAIPKTRSTAAIRWVNVNVCVSTTATVPSFTFETYRRWCCESSARPSGVWPV